MLKHSNIPDTAVPTELENDNAIRVNYKTNLLLPSLGPLLAARYLSWFENLFLDFVFTRDILEALKIYYVTYKTVLQMQTDTPLEIYTAVSSRKMQDLLDQLITKHVDSINTELKKYNSVNPKSSTPGNLFLNKAKLYGPIKEYKLNVPGLSPEIQNGIKQRLDALKILNMLQRKNVIISDLFTLGVLKDKGEIISSDILTKEINFALLAELLKPKATLTRTIDDIEGADSLISRSMRNTDNRRNVKLLQLYINNDYNFKENLNNYLIWKLENIQKKNSYATIVGLLRLSEDMNKNREWAFQRFEELRLSLGTPFFRGPVSANSVTPQSSLKITETTMQTFEENRIVLTSETRKESNSQSIISSSQFQQALDNMTHYGISKMDSSADNMKETITSTMREEKRTTVETVAKEISMYNETIQSTRTIATTGRSTEYITHGKDPKLATTELAYQVVVPAQAAIKLRGIGLVWCPRVPSPFLSLHKNIREYGLEQEKEYLMQNYVLPPLLEPLKVYQASKTEVHKLYDIDGTTEYQKRDFEHSFELSDPNAVVESSEIDCIFNNVGGDDLEEFDEYVQNIAISETSSGNEGSRIITVTGTVVLETPDPEYFNEGNIDVYIPVSSLTPASKEAIDAAKEEYFLKKAAVESRARQYAAMKRDELIESYQDRIKLRSEAFRSLIRNTFKNAPKSHQSYYEEVLSRCIDWTTSHIIFESQPMDLLIFKHLAPDHFMNCPAIRFFLTIRPETEEIFFDTLKKGASDFYLESAKTVKDYIKNLSSQVKIWKDSNAEELVLDEFGTEIIIGRHLEAVLSKFEFSS